MLAVDDPEISWATSVVFNGTAYFILEDIEFYKLPWLSG